MYVFGMDTVPMDWAKLYRLQDSGEGDDAIDLIYDAVCSFDRHPDFAAINATPEAVDVERLTTTNALAFLTAAYSNSPFLPHYTALFERVRGCFASRGIDEQYIQALLQGLDRVPEGRMIFVPLTPPEGTD